MEIKKYILFLVISFCFSKEEYNYKINYLGMHVADCIISYNDTLIYFNGVQKNDSINAVNIKVDVLTTGIIDKLFEVNNNYRLTIDQNSGDLLYYKKISSQPNVTNYIETNNITYENYINKQISYKNYHDIFSDSFPTIFSIFYLLTHNIAKIPVNHDFIIEREAKLYRVNIKNKIANKFDLFINEKDSNKGVVEHTDIFSWAIFMEDGKKIIYLNKESNRIEKCIFKKGLINLSADYYDK